MTALLGRAIAPQLARHRVDRAVSRMDRKPCRVSTAFEGSFSIMKLPPFEYACPATISEAVQLLASHDGRQGPRRRPEPGADAGVPPGAPLAAGRPAQARRAAPDQDFGERGVALGAMVRWRDIEDDARLAAAHPLLKAAISHVAHYQIRNRGTVGGSIAHADPAAEMPGIAVTCDAEIDGGRQGRRAGHPAADFFLGPLTTALEPDEIITEVRLAGLAGAPALGLPGIRPAARRFRHGSGGGVLRSGRARQGPQRPCRRHRRRRPAAAARRRRSRAERQRGRRGDDRAAEAAASARSIRPTISTPAPPIAALVGTMVERALKARRAGTGAADHEETCRHDSKSTASRSRSMSSRA